MDKELRLGEGLAQGHGAERRGVGQSGCRAHSVLSTNSIGEQTLIYSFNTGALSNRGLRVTEMVEGAANPLC